MSAAADWDPLYRVREATAPDNSDLLRLADLCPMEGDIGLCVSRAPDFFALNRLEGDSWSVALAERDDGTAIGCAAVARRRVYLAGRPHLIGYFGDLKVDPAARRLGVGRALLRWAARRIEELVGVGTPVLATVLAGNTAAERLLLGGGAIAFREVATVRAFSIPLFAPRRHKGLLSVEPAREEDIEEMADLWRAVAANRPFAHVFDAATLRSWIAGAPALGLASYRVCRSRDGRLVAFAGLWDQRPFKRLRVTRYSWTLRAVALGLNAASALLGRPRLPPVGEFLDYVSLVNVCARDPLALRSLLAAAYDELRSRRYVLMSLGLDRNDPLASAVAGLGAQSTDVKVLTAATAGPARAPEGPAHHEIALV